MKTEIKLGQKVKDNVTEFTGIAVAKCLYLNGCVQFQIVPKFNPVSGILYRNLWVDESQLKIINNGVLPKDIKADINPKPKKLIVESPYKGGGIRSHPND